MFYSFYHCFCNSEGETDERRVWKAQQSRDEHMGMLRAFEPRDRRERPRLGRASDRAPSADGRSHQKGLSS